MESQLWILNNENVWRIWLIAAMVNQNHGPYVLDLHCTIKVEQISVSKQAIKDIASAPCKLQPMHTEPSL